MSTVVGPIARLRQVIWNSLDNPRVVKVASLVALAQGFFFLFVWTPLPWGWEGIDHYHDRALNLLAGRPFDTTDVPWGYAYYLAAVYWIFAPEPWIPLVGQVVLNAAVPFLVFALARQLTDRRTAVLGAALAGVLSFNTVYAATQSTDAVCTVLFLTSLVLFERAHRADNSLLFATSGLLAGLAPQFRPNLVLFPVIAAAAYVLLRRTRRRAAAHMTVYLGVAAVALLPWVVRNYRLTGAFVPTSTHGGVQLWYGSLQTGPYLEDRAANPRAAFEPAAFDYTSLVGVPIVIEAFPPACGDWKERSVQLVYWTSRDSTRYRVAPEAVHPSRLTFTVPGQPDHTVVRFYFEATSRSSADAPVLRHPSGGSERPLVLFVSTDHLGDPDRNDEILNVFDLARQVNGVEREQAIVTDRPASGTSMEVIAGTATTLARAAGIHLDASAVRIERTEDATALIFPDESRLVVPRQFRILTDLVAEGRTARALVHAHAARALNVSQVCTALEYVGINDVFYRRELHLQKRYMALAIDNIRRAPAAYALSVLYRAVRLFVVRGSDNPAAVQQFARSRLMFTAGGLISGAYFALFVAGAIVAYRRCRPALPLLIPILYVPATISFVLTNMRYTITVQPLVFVFVALAIVTLLEWSRSRRDGGLRDQT